VCKATAITTGKLNVTLLNIGEREICSISTNPYDNAHYHSIQIDKPLTKSPPKPEMSEYLQWHRVTQKIGMRN
jgi:hypothetical protein